MTEPPTIIIVDDDAEVREALSSLVRSVGLQTKALASVPEFLSEGRPDGPTCLVLDVRLPGRSGLDFQRGLTAANIHVPIIFITGHGDIPITVQPMKGAQLSVLPTPERTRSRAGCRRKCARLNQGIIQIIPVADRAVPRVQWHDRGQIVILLAATKKPQDGIERKRAVMSEFGRLIEREIPRLRRY